MVSGPNSVGLGYIKQALGPNTGGNVKTHTHTYTHTRTHAHTKQYAYTREVKWIILCHTVKHLSLTLCTKFDSRLLTIFKVKIEQTLSHFLWARCMCVAFQDYSACYAWWTLRIETEAQMSVLNIILWTATARTTTSFRWLVSSRTLKIWTIYTAISRLIYTSIGLVYLLLSFIFLFIPAAVCSQQLCSLIRLRLNIGLGYKFCRWYGV